MGCLQLGKSLMNVLICDPSEVIRVGLKSAFSGSGLSVCAELDSPEDVVLSCDRHRADVLITELRFPNANVFAMLDELRQSELGTRVVLFTDDENPTNIARSLLYGATSHFSKTTPLVDLVRAIRSMASGELTTSRISQNVSSFLASRGHTSQFAGTFTSREDQVVRHLALGMSNKEIATSPGLSLETIKEHVKNIMRKLAVSDRTSAAIWAVKTGILDGIAK